MSYVALDIFERLRPDDIHWLLANAEIKSIAAGRVLVREDDPSDTIYFIADGLFEVFVYSGFGSHLKVGQLGPGEVIGEISWLDRGRISASIRAVETGSVMALSTSALEDKLAQDTGFAAGFLRAIATSTAERLRQTTAALRRSQRMDSVQLRSSDANRGQQSALFQRIETLKGLLAAGQQRAAAGNGTIAEADARQIRDWFTAFEQQAAHDGAPAGGAADVLQGELLPYLQLSATVQRCQARPRGYTGDYQTLAMIDANTPAGTGPMGALLDSCVLNLAAMTAMRWRRARLATELQALFEGSTRDFHLTSLACGPVGEIFDVFARAADKARLSVNCVDVDREALEYVAARAKEHALEAQVQTLQANLITLGTGRQELDLAPQDLIYSIGFVDSLNDELALMLLNWIHDKLRPGGRVILSALHPRNPSRLLMDHVLDWRLNHRDEAEMDYLFQRSKFAKLPTRVIGDPAGVGLLVEGTK